MNSQHKDDSVDKLLESLSEWLPKGAGILFKSDLQALIATAVQEARIETLRSIDCIVYDPMDLERYLDDRIKALQANKGKE